MWYHFWTLLLSRCRCQSKQIMKKQTRKKKKRVTVSYKCELRALPSLALLALLLSVCRSFKALYWQRSVLCSAVHVVVQCSGVHCRDGGRSKICGGWEGQAVIKSSFDEIYILLLCRPISGKGRKAKTAPCPLQLPSYPLFRRLCWVYYCALSALTSDLTAQPLCLPPPLPLLTHCD